MFATLIELEMLVLEEMSREQLIAALLEERDCLSLEFTREWLAEQSTDGLRLFMLAAKLVRVLRQNRSRTTATRANRLGKKCDGI
ncbi:MAG TPA: hypothetical protein VG099_08460 [Gemmataceae bacterium]|jgi:hypothetical protein|nr:hypothetical protein [Gemmataceae bacterium]